jgi:hypothetical protein
VMDRITTRSIAVQVIVACASDVLSQHFLRVHRLTHIARERGLRERKTPPSAPQWPHRIPPPKTAVHKRRMMFIRSGIWYIQMLGCAAASARSEETSLPSHSSRHDPHQQLRARDLGHTRVVSPLESNENVVTFVFVCEDTHRPQGYQGQMTEHRFHERPDDNSSASNEMADQMTMNEPISTRTTPTNNLDRDDVRPEAAEAGAAPEHHKPLRGVSRFKRGRPIDHARISHTIANRDYHLLDRGEANYMIYCLQPFAGRYPLEHLCVGYITELAIERWGEFEGVDDYADTACACVADKWLDWTTSNIIDEAKDYALELIAERAEYDGIELVRKAQIPPSTVPPMVEDNDD